MPTLYIPPGFVPFLDALALPDVDPAEHLQQFKSELTAMQGWYDYNSTHSLDDEEADLLENLRFLVGEMQWAVDNEDLSKKKALLEKLVPNLYQAISVMEQINLKREKAAYSKIPALNDLLIAGACYLMGRGELEAIDFRMEPADLAYQNLRRQLRYSFQRLKPEIGESFRIGVEHLSQGLDELDEAVGKQDRAAIQAGLAQIKDGSDILEHFVSWYQNDQVRLSAQNTTFAIPVLGPTLELNLDAAKKFAKDTWGRGLKTLYEDNLPEFFAFWERAQKQIFVSAQEREELVSRVEEALNELRAALEIMGDGEQSKEAGVQAFESAINSLADAFEDIRARCPDTTHLPGTPIGNYFGILAGALAGQVPVVAISELLHSQPPDPSWRGAIETALLYASDGDHRHLYDAIAELLALAPTSATLTVSASWTCPTCGASNPPDLSKCGGCQRPAPAISIAEG